MSKSEVKIFLQIEKQGYGYTVSATYKKEKCSKPLKFEKTLYLDMVGSSDNLKVKEYRCYGHNLNSYFQNNIKSIKKGDFENRSDSGINFRSDINDLKDVEVKLKVAISKVKIKIYDKDDRILNNLSYTGEEYLQNRNVYVYFYNPSNGETDTLPLLFQYKDTFYGPESREKYFEKWKEVTELNEIINKQVNVDLTNESQELKTQKDQKVDKIRNKLDEIFKMLNEVNLVKRSDYGIPYCSKEFINRNDFNTKRFKVKVSKNDKYQKITHTSVNKYLIGSIKGVENCKFEDHIDKMRKEDVINEVVVYFSNKENSPELILLNEKVGYDWSSTYGYYEKQNNVYIYKHFKHGIDIEFPGDGNFDDEESHVIETLKKMKDEEMIDHTQQFDTDTAKCQKEYEEDSEDGQCPSPVIDTYSDILSSGISPQRTVQQVTLDNQPIDQVTERNGLVRDRGENILQTEVTHTQTENRPSQGQEQRISSEYEQMQEESLLKRGESGHKIEEMAMDSPESNIEVNITNQSTGSMGQNLSRKEEANLVHESEHQKGVEDQDSIGNNHIQSGGRNGEAEQVPGRLPEIPCTGEGKGTTHYVNTGTEGFDDLMNGAIDYAKNNPGVVSTAGAGSILSCAGGGYGVYKLFLRLR